jgi:putative DNA primase/helicase
VSNCTTATLYRAIEKFQPTMLIDEADSFLGESNELRGIINSGFTRGSGVIRTTGDDYEPRIFSTFAPKAIAGIKMPPDTIADRSIMITMERKTKFEFVKRFRKVSLPEVQQKCQRWATDNQPGEIEPALPESLGDREQDAWEPLFAMAELVGGEWPERAKQAAVHLCGANDDDSIDLMLLSDIRVIIGDEARIKSADLVEALNRLDDRPWPTWARGTGLTPNTLSRKLKPYKIRSKSKRFPDGTNVKGYESDQFGSTFDRYLPPLDSQGVTPSQSHNHAGSVDSQTVTPENDVTDANGPKPASLNQCDDVTVPVTETSRFAAEEAEWRRREGL